MAEETKKTETPSAKKPSKAEVDAAKATLVEEFGIYADERKLTPEEAVEKAKKLKDLKVRAAQILRRGQTLDIIDQALRLLPEGHYGQLVRNNDTDIQRYQALGFDFARKPEEADVEKVSPHSEADTRIVIGDCVLMTIDADEVSVIQSIKSQRAQERIGAGKRQFFDDAKDHGLPIVGEPTPPTFGGR